MWKTPSKTGPVPIFLLSFILCMNNCAISKSLKITNIYTIDKKDIENMQLSYFDSPFTTTFRYSSKFNSAIIVSYVQTEFTTYFKSFVAFDLNNTKYINRTNRVVQINYEISNIRGVSISNIDGYSLCIYGDKTYYINKDGMLTNLDTRLMIRKACLEEEDYFNNKLYGYINYLEVYNIDYDWNQENVFISPKNNMKEWEMTYELTTRINIIELWDNYALITECLNYELGWCQSEKMTLFSNIDGSIMQKKSIYYLGSIDRIIKTNDKEMIGLSYLGAYNILNIMMYKIKIN